MSLLLNYLFDEIHRESTASTTRPVDFAIKLGIVDVLKTEGHYRNPFDPDGKDEAPGETIRDLLDLDNSATVRVSKSKGIAKYLTEQFVGTAEEAIELVQKALEARRFRQNEKSFMMLQFTVVHMEYQRRNLGARVLHELHEEDGAPPDLDDISLDSVYENRKSFLRIFDGVQLTDPHVRELIERGADDQLTRLAKEATMESGVQRLLKDPLGGNSQTTMILCLSPSAKSQEH